jgi:hypothetical protein
MTKTSKMTAVVTIIVIIMYLWSACNRKVSAPNDNILPNTTLANIPVGDGDTMFVEVETGIDTVILQADTLFALVTLHWDGEDEDGFIAGYQYRYITKHVYMGDEFETEWKDTTATSVTIAFESSDILNYQTFQVRAVDNSGDVDPTPAEKKFYTKQTIFPETKILIPSNTQQFFVIEQTTDWWQGIQLTFSALDEDGEVLEYAWAVDNSEWNWGEDTTLYIIPDQFIPLEGEHIIRVTSRDNTNLEDPVGDSVVVNLLMPSFDKKILIIDETLEGSLPVGVTASDSEVDSFYADIFGTTESWDYQNGGMPPKDILGQYQLVIWHADNCYSSPSNYHKLPDHIEDIEDYLNVGGDFIMSGWRILKSFSPDDNFPKVFEEGTFIHDYLHIKEADETPLSPSDFTGAAGLGSFSDIKVDSVLMSSAFPYFGKLAQINIMPDCAGFTDVIYSYRNPDDSDLWRFRGQACGLRYYGTSFNAVVLGFPIFFIDKDDAKILAGELLSSLGY